MLLNETPQSEKISVQAAQKVAEKGYGTIVTHEYLRSLLRCDPPPFGTHDDFIAYSFELLQAVDSLKTELLHTHRILLRNLRGSGYQLVEPSQQTTIAMERFVDSFHRAIRRAGEELEYINHSLLNQEERQKNTEAKAKIASARSLALVS